MNSAENIFVNVCPTHILSFNLSDVSSWESCSDAYSTTWSSDCENDLVGLDSISKEKLVKSMGFCPQSRCQLGSVGNADYEGMCPSGLCYLKLIDGASSFGTCCYTNGTFSSGDILGFYSKTQPSPKPIYSSSRVVLGSNSSDESFESFMNANVVFPHVIATQCPIISQPGFTDTLNDVKQMIMENNISLWMELAPTLPSLDVLTNVSYWMTLDTCKPFALFLNSSINGYDQGVSDFRIHNLEQASNGSVPFLWLSYSLTGYQSQNSSDSSTFTFDKPSTPFKVYQQTVNHYWYLNWTDFSVPPPSDNAVSFLFFSFVFVVVRCLMSFYYYYFFVVVFVLFSSLQVITNLVSLASKTLEEGGTIGVNCQSGRGRTGTFTSMAIGQYQNITTLDDLVNAIVLQRSHRDNLVETPGQFRYITTILGLPDSGTIGAATPSPTSSPTSSSSNSSNICPWLARYGIPIGVIIGILSMMIFQVFLHYLKKRTATSTESSSSLLARSKSSYNPLRKSKYPSSSSTTMASLNDMSDFTV